MSSATTLRRLPRDTLRPGKRVPGTIFDEHGQILLRAGALLTSAQLQALNRRGLSRCFVGSDWPHDPTQDTVQSARSLAAILNKNAATAKKHHCRRHERHACETPVHIELDEEHPLGTAARTLSAMTIDLSAGGMAFESESYVHPGTTLVARFEKLANQPSVRGVVRSCIHLGGRRHRIGVEFIFTQEQPSEPDTTDTASPRSEA